MKGWKLALLLCMSSSAVCAGAQTYIFGRADFSAGVGTIALASGDFNHDGLTDIAAVNESGNTVSILLGKPDGTFAPQSTYATGLGPLAIVAGDFDGDGNLDLAITDAGCVPGKSTFTCDVRTVSILLGNGDGTFRQHVNCPTGTQSAGSGCVTADITSTAGY